MCSSSSLADEAFGDQRIPLFSTISESDENIVRLLESKSQKLALGLTQLRGVVLPKSYTSTQNPQLSSAFANTEARLKDADLAPGMFLQPHDSIWQALAYQITGNFNATEDLRTAILFSLSRWKADYEAQEFLGVTNWKTMFRLVRTALVFTPLMYKLFCQVFLANVVIVFINPDGITVKRISLEGASKLVYLVLHTLPERPDHPTVYSLLPGASDADINDDAFVKMSQETVNLFPLEEKLKDEIGPGYPDLGMENNGKGGAEREDEEVDCAESGDQAEEAARKGKRDGAGKAKLVSGQKRLVGGVTGSGKQRGQGGPPSPYEHEAKDQPLPAKSPCKKARLITDKRVVVVMDRDQDLLRTIHMCFSTNLLQYVMFKTHPASHTFTGKSMKEFRFLKDRKLFTKLNSNALWTRILNTKLMICSVEIAKRRPNARPRTPYEMYLG